MGRHVSAYETWRNLGRPSREEEKSIEEYSDERLKGFLVADRISKAEVSRIKKGKEQAPL